MRKGSSYSPSDPQDSVESETVPAETPEAATPPPDPEAEAIKAHWEKVRQDYARQHAHNERQIAELKKQGDAITAKEADLDQQEKDALAEHEAEKAKVKAAEQKQKDERMGVAPKDDKQPVHV